MKKEEFRIIMIETTKNMTGNNSTNSTKKSIQDEIASFLVSNAQVEFPRISNVQNVIDYNAGSQYFEICIVDLSRKQMKIYNLNVQWEKSLLRICIQLCSLYKNVIIYKINIQTNDGKLSTTMGRLVVNHDLPLLYYRILLESIR